MKDYEIKDSILRHISKIPGANTVSIARDLKLDHKMLLNTLRRISANGYVIDLEEINTGKDDFFTAITDKGEMFIEDGGYTGAYKKGRMKRRWGRWFKFVTVILFPAVAIGVGVWQGILNNKTNKLEEKNERLQQQVDSLITNSATRKVYFPADVLKQRDSVDE